MPKFTPEEFKQNIMNRFFSSIVEQEEAIQQTLEKLKSNPENPKMTELLIKKLCTALEKLNTEIKKANQSYSKQKSPSLDAIISMIIMHSQVLNFIAKTFAALNQSKMFDDKLVQKAYSFIELFEKFRATHKKTFKVINTAHINYQKSYEDFLEHSVLIRDYILPAKRNTSEVEYLDNILLSIISLNKLIQLKKNQPFTSRSTLYLELLLKKTNLAKFYFDKHHFKTALDYLEKTIPLFQLLHQHASELSEQPPLPGCYSEVALFTHCKKTAFSMYLNLAEHLNNIELQHSALYAAILFSRMYQVACICFGSNSPVVKDINERHFLQHSTNLKLLITPNFEWEVDAEKKLIHFHFTKKFFHPSILIKFEKFIDWTYENLTLTLKNSGQICPSLFGEIVLALENFFNHLADLEESNNKVNEALKEASAETPLIPEEKPKENNNQTDNPSPNENIEKQPKLKTRGTPRVEENNNAEQPPKPPNTYTARELHFFVPKKYEHAVVRELTGADIPDGVFYGIYDFHPNDQDIKKLGISVEQLALYETKFDEAHLVTDSKTGIVITKDRDFHVNVYDPKSTETDEPKVIQDIHLHTGLKISIAPMDHRIEAEPISATKTEAHTPILWRFFKPTTHKNDNIKLSANDDSCNNNQTAEEVKSINNNSIKI